MFPKKNRITKTGFDTLLKKGSVFHSPYFSLRYNKKDSSLPQFAFVVSKKVAKNAVERNILRRRGFSSLRNLCVLGKESKWNGVIGAFFFKKEAKGLSFEEIKKEIEGLLMKI